jgi:hypothetical protein
MAKKMTLENYDILNGIVDDLDPNDLDGWEDFLEDCKMFKGTKGVLKEVREGIHYDLINKDRVGMLLVEAYTGT